MNPWDIVNWAFAIVVAILIVAVGTSLAIIMINTARRQK